MSSTIGSVDEINNLGILYSLENQIKLNIDILTQDFFRKNEKTFNSLAFNKKVYSEGLSVRKDVLDFIENKCSEIVSFFNNDKEQFDQSYGWYTNEMTKTRHNITIDELSYELCEIVRKMYYSYTEDKFPEKYKVTVAEEFLLSE